MRKIPVELYHCEILAFNDFKDFQRYCNRQNVLTKDFNGNCLVEMAGLAGGMAGTLEYQDQDKCDFFVHVDYSSYEGEDGFAMTDYLESVSHEFVHMSFFILDNVGVEVDPSNHEALCYLQGYLVRQWLEKFKIFENGKK